MNKPKLQLVDLTFDIAFEAMRDNDEVRESAYFCDPDDIDAFVDGLDNIFEVAELTDEDILAVGWRTQVAPLRS